MYFIKAPWWLKKIYSSFIWKIPTKEKVIYLTFDDGPHETATPFVLDELKKYGAKATFFCIGKNVAGLPLLYKRIFAEGHKAGNHTYDHLNGWKTDDTTYINNVVRAAELIKSNLFRPPYGRIKKFQSKVLMHQKGSAHPLFKIIMWDVLSGDFDVNLTPQQCLNNVLKHTEKGSIVVFHDSTKAWSRMSYVVPRILEHYSKEGYVFKVLE
jgi:peptidoglycan/xylan/chitin deacetylase (PgdA/CDA1 family)